MGYAAGVFLPGWVTGPSDRATIVAKAERGVDEASRWQAGDITGSTNGDAGRGGDGGRGQEAGLRRLGPRDRSAVALRQAPVKPVAEQTPPDDVAEGAPADT